MNRQNKILGIGAAVFIFIVYNILFFVIGGVREHGGAYWISYAFMLLAYIFAMLGIYIQIVTVKTLKDWFIGYPLFRHSYIYVITELIISIIFMFFDAYISNMIAFLVQFLIFAIYIIIVVSCLVAKNIIEDKRRKISDDTLFMKNLYVDFTEIINRLTDSQIKNLYLTISEKIRYSDPVTNQVLADLENQITAVVSQIKYSIQISDESKLIDYGNQLNQLIDDRNRKCKMYKNKSLL